jgi:hypothetical protein
MATQDSDNVAITGGNVVGSIGAFDQWKAPPELGYPTGGAVALNFSGKTNVLIGLTVNATFSSVNLSAGVLLVLTLRNPGSSLLTLAWPASWNWASTRPPTRIGPGQSFIFNIYSYSTADADVFVRFTAQQPNVFNVRDYGAVGNGIADDTAAIAAAFAAAADTTATATVDRGACVYFPEGNYLISGLITITLGTSTLTQSLTIRGDGIGISIISQSAANTGVFNVALQDRTGFLKLVDLQIYNRSSSSLSSASAVYVVCNEEAPNDSHPNFFAEDVHIGGKADGSSKTFNIGLELRNMHNSKLNGFMFIGNNAGGGTGVLFAKKPGGPGLGPDKCIAATLYQCHFSFSQRGIHITDNMESCLIDGCVFVANIYGIVADYCIHLGVFNSHFNSNASGALHAIFSTGIGAGGAVDQSVINGNSLYSEIPNQEAVKGPFVRSSISGNQFLATNSSLGTVGIRLTTGSVGVNISGNNFAWHRTAYVIADAGATYNMVTANTATRDVAAATNPFLDNGTNNSFTNNVSQP